MVARRELLEEITEFALQTGDEALLALAASTLPHPTLRSRAAAAGRDFVQAIPVEDSSDESSHPVSVVASGRREYVCIDGATCEDEDEGCSSSSSSRRRSRDRSTGRSSGSDRKQRIRGIYNGNNSNAILAAAATASTTPALSVAPAAAAAAASVASEITSHMKNQLHTLVGGGGTCSSSINLRCSSVSCRHCDKTNNSNSNTSRRRRKSHLDRIYIITSSRSRSG